VRLLIGDTDLEEPGNHIFQDEEIDAFLAMEASVVKLAAAQALDTMASSEAMILKKIRILDLTTDGPAVAKELRERASTLRDLYYDGDDQLPDTAELVLDPHTYAERLNNERLRP
jgi:hypothetical protein